MPRSRRRHGSIDPILRDQPLDGAPSDPDTVPEVGWTKHELMTAGDLSGRGFDTMRKAARVQGPTHGGLRHIFSADDLIRLIAKAESGKFTINGAQGAIAWRKMLAEAGIAMPDVVSRARNY